MPLQAGSACYQPINMCSRKFAIGRSKLLRRGVERPGDGRSGFLQGLPKDRAPDRDSPVTPCLQIVGKAHENVLALHHPRRIFFYVMASRRSLRKGNEKKISTTASPRHV
jgi:hypothetical protein